MKYLVSKKIKWMIFKFSLISFLASSLNVFSAFLLTFLMSEAIKPSPNLKVIVFWGVTIALLYLMSIFLDYFQGLYHSKIVYYWELILRKKAIEKITLLSQEELTEIKKGEILTWITTYVEQIKSHSLSLTLQLISSWIRIVVNLIVLFFISWIVTLICLAIVPLVWYSPKILEKKIKKSYTDVAIENEIYLSKTENLISGYNEFIISNKKDDFVNLFDKPNNDLAEKEYVSSKTTESLKFLLSFFQSFFGFIVLLLAIIFSYFKLMNISGVLSVSRIIPTFLILFVAVSNNKTVYNSNKSILEKFRFLPRKKYIPKHKNFNNLRIESLNYKINEKIIFDNFNLQINKNEKVLIVGESGSGKSTLFNILSQKINKWDGKITINNSLNYKQITNEELFEIVDVVDQQPVFFNDTLKNNLTLFDQQIDNKIILDALKKVNMLDWFKKNKNNFDMQINSESKNISAGEMQRLSLARALIRNKDILLLDEITANLDKKNRKIIEDVILNLDKTVFFISHSIENQNSKKFSKLVQLKNNNIKKNFNTKS